MINFTRQFVLDLLRLLMRLRALLVIFLALMKYHQFNERKRKKGKKKYAGHKKAKKKVLFHFKILSSKKEQNP